MALSGCRNRSPPPAPGRPSRPGRHTSVVAAGGVLTGRAFAAVAYAWKAAAPHPR